MSLEEQQYRAALQVWLDVTQGSPTAAERSLADQALYAAEHAFLVAEGHTFTSLGTTREPTRIKAIFNEELGRR